MKTSTGSLLAALSWASVAYGKTVQYCPSNANSVCYQIGVPSSSASSGSGNIYFQISAPTTYQWVALGTGSGMVGANIFLMYQDGSGNVTLSPRHASSYSTPSVDTSSTGARLTLLAGSGVSSDGKTMVANIRCANCESWTGGGSISLTSSAGWIGAWKAGSSLATTGANAQIDRHDETTTFSLDMKQAAVSSDSNPFLQSSTSTSGGGGTSSGDDDDTGSGSNTGNGVTVSESAGSGGGAVAVHGILLTLVFVILYPLGSLLMPLRGSWVLHGVWQGVSFVLMLVGFGIGLHEGDERNELFKQSHTILGTVVVCLLLIQPVLGYLHHRHYVAHQRRGVVSHVHIWYGRVLMVLGVVAGGLGLELSNAKTPVIVAYSVVSAIVFLVYFVGKLWKSLSRRNRHSIGSDKDGINMQTPVGRRSQEPPRGPSFQEPKRQGQGSARKAVAAVSRLAVRTQMRTFIAPTVSRRADFVQELYLKELKAYKPTPIKESDSVGNVSTFALPKTPKSPEESDLASSLKVYETMAVEVEGQEGAEAGKPAAVVEDWLVEEEDEDDHKGH
ncbi:putative carbohydrate binding protein [Cercophora scortea]|uniref:Carbohydrate binding protein n=1 Tax=Cercophora scortea TaxID=314031 RepID=A0AAE0J424_9PEZI|nr:putative carbohydrate binding protein [Cercophora scortea]